MNLPALDSNLAPGGCLRDIGTGGTGYDYMHYRFYGSSMGRFLRPDNIPGALTDPQSWNLYAYVRNNPANATDPTGHQAEIPYSYKQHWDPSQGINAPQTGDGAANSGDPAGDKEIQALLRQLQRGSLHLSASFVAALQNNPAFRRGVERWLSTKVGQQQLKMYQDDKNTSYKLSVGPVT
jgi:RHS repeat-associated protein